jgi:ribosome-binding factor A
VGSLIREMIGTMLLDKLSDPRIDPARTSVTRVEVQEDLLRAKVFVSVLGTGADTRKTLRALRHAAGHIQELVGKKISLRHTPVLDFEIDTRFKKTMETLEIIEQAMEEIRQKEQAEPAVAEAGDEDPPAS